jgi:phosphate transport system permease protein
MTNPPPSRSPRTGPFVDRLFGWAAKGAALLTLAVLVAILGSLFVGAWPAIAKYGLGFLTSTTWDPVTEDFGGLVMIYGTLATSIIALLIAVPVSFGIALFLTELSPAWLKRPLGTAIELLAAVPSIVYGMWGLLVFSPILSTYRAASRCRPCLVACPMLGALFSGSPVGIGILSAGIILAIMIIPFIAAVMRDVFEVTPPLLKESAYGLGATTWEVVSTIVLPYTKAGCHRRHHARAGPRAGRDHGRDLRDRQFQPARFAEPVSRLPTASPRRSPTNLPKRVPACTRLR